jgi:hypothetical protein
MSYDPTAIIRQTRTDAYQLVSLTAPISLIPFVLSRITAHAAYCIERDNFSYSKSSSLCNTMSLATIHLAILPALSNMTILHCTNSKHMIC